MISPQFIKRGFQGPVDLDSYISKFRFSAERGTGNPFRQGHFRQLPEWRSPPAGKKSNYSKNCLIFVMFTNLPKHVLRKFDYSRVVKGVLFWKKVFMIFEIRGFWIPPGGGENPFPLKMLGYCEVHNPSQTSFTKTFPTQGLSGEYFL